MKIPLPLPRPFLCLNCCSGEVGRDIRRGYRPVMHKQEQSQNEHDDVIISRLKTRQMPCGGKVISILGTPNSASSIFPYKVRFRLSLRTQLSAAGRYRSLFYTLNLFSAIGSFGRGLWRVVVRLTLACPNSCVFCKRSSPKVCSFKS